MDEDWRLSGQEDDLKGVTLVRRTYRPHPDNPDWDHDHCEFCGAKFTLRTEEGAVNKGYATLDDYRWICSTCFEDFRERFGWKVIEE